MHCVVLLVTALITDSDLSAQEMLDRAVETGAKKVVLPEGRVEVEGKLRLSGAEDLVIEGQGTTLVFSDHRGTTWSFNSCRNIILRGFTIDYDPLPFIQGRITSRSTDGKRYDFVVCDGYPGLCQEDSEHYRQAYIFEPGRHRWKPWVPDLYARQVEIVDERHGRFVMGYVPTYHDLIEVGDRIVLTIRSGSAIRMNDCENVRIEDVTFLAAPGCAYLGRYMRGDNYYRYTIKPGPTPPGATEPRLISTCADGLNIAFATKGPTIEGCKFSFMGDDSVNLHGATFVVLEQKTPTELLVAWPYSREYLASVIPEGATARRLRPGNYEVLGTAKLTAFVPVRERQTKHVEAIHRVWPRNEKDRGTVFRLTLAEPLPAEPGEFLDIPASNAPGFVIRECVFEDHRARGLRIMASQGVIERNTFRRLKMAAVTIGAEFEFWREAGWVEGVTIRGNTIEDVGRDGQIHGSSAYVLGAISVFGRTDRGSNLPLWPGNRRIVIEGNTIRDCPMAGVFAAAASGVQVRGNRLENCFFRPGESAGTARGLDIRSPIDVRHAENAVVESNVIVEARQSPTSTKTNSKGAPR
jgi:hypothetical protein